MSKLERWLPFKFFRKDTEKNEQTASPKQKTEAAMTRAPSRETALTSMPFFSPTANQMLQSMFGESFFRDPFARFAEMDRWFGDFSPERFVPNVEVTDEAKALRVTAELPGMSKEDVKLQVDGDMLVISGEKKNQDEKTEDGVFRTERYYGYFQRAVPLPQDVDRDHAEADFRDGVLTVRLPKVAATKEQGRSIPISAS